MDTKYRNSIIGAAAMLLATGAAWGDPNCDNPAVAANNKHCQNPEIDATSGTSAIALVSGIVLLMRERARTKRASKPDEREE